MNGREARDGGLWLNASVRHKRHSPGIHHRRSLLLIIQIAENGAKNVQSLEIEECRVCRLARSLAHLFFPTSGGIQLAISWPVARMRSRRSPCLRVPPIE